MSVSASVVILAGKNNWWHMHLYVNYITITMKSKFPWKLKIFPAHKRKWLTITMIQKLMHYCRNNWCYHLNWQYYHRIFISLIGCVGWVLTSEEQSPKTGLAGQTALVANQRRCIVINCRWDYFLISYESSQFSSEVYQPILQMFNLWHWQITSSR